RDRGPPAVAHVEVPELDPQHRRLQLVETAVGAVEVVLVLAYLTVPAEEPDALGDPGVVGADQARVAVGGEVLHHAQAEGAREAEGTDAAPVERGAVGVRAVLDHDEPARPREPEDGPAVARTP